MFKSGAASLKSCKSSDRLQKTKKNDVKFQVLLHQYFGDQLSILLSTFSIHAKKGHQ